MRRFWAENVNKTNKKGVYSTLLFEDCRVNGFRTHGYSAVTTYASARMVTSQLLGVSHLLGTSHLLRRAVQVKRSWA